VVRIDREVKDAVDGHLKEEIIRIAEATLQRFADVDSRRCTANTHVRNPLFYEKVGERLLLDFNRKPLASVSLANSFVDFLKWNNGINALFIHFFARENKNWTLNSHRNRKMMVGV